MPQSGVLRYQLVNPRPRLRGLSVLSSVGRPQMAFVLQLAQRMSVDVASPLSLALVVETGSSTRMMFAVGSVGWVPGVLVVPGKRASEIALELVRS